MGRIGKRGRGGKGRRGVEEWKKEAIDFIFFWGGGGGVLYGRQWLGDTNIL